MLNLKLFLSKIQQLRWSTDLLWNAEIQLDSNGHFGKEIRK